MEHARDADAAGVRARRMAESMVRVVTDVGKGVDPECRVDLACRSRDGDFTGIRRAVNAGQTGFT